MQQKLVGRIHDLNQKYETRELAEALTYDNVDDYPMKDLDHLNKADINKQISTLDKQLEEVKLAFLTKRIGGEIINLKTFSRNDSQAINEEHITLNASFDIK
jgi:tRNA A37 threonylcarbamoyladenosine dehydratase